MLWNNLTQAFPFPNFFERQRETESKHVCVCERVNENKKRQTKF